LVSYKHNRKPIGVWPTFVSFLGAHAFQGDGQSLVYYHASTTWDEPSPEEKKRVIGFQIGTTNHTKVTRLECNALLGRSMDLNSLTWFLVTCVLFQMYITPTLIQSTCSSNDATTWKQQVVRMACDAFWIEECTCFLSTSQGLGSQRGRFPKVLHRWCPSA
jgi:hypothetical protein